MDWSRAKTILIVAFLLLNIFLVSVIFYSSSNIRFQSDYIRYAREYLDSKNIAFETDVPHKNGRAGKLVYKDKAFDLDKIAMIVFGSKVPPRNNLDSVEYVKGNEKLVWDSSKLIIRDHIDVDKNLMQETKELEKKIYSYLESIGYAKKSLIYRDSVESTDEKKMSFVLKYKDAILFDRVITVSISANGLLELTCPSREPKRESEQIEIVSAYQVLVMSNIPQNAIIGKVEFGYKRVDTEDLFESPVWRIEINGLEHFYNAVTGEKVE